MERVTIKDVAREAGVSPSAVSRVFTEGASASTRTRERVLAAADRLGYRPSLLARGLVSNRTNLVSLVTGPLSDPFDALLLERLSEALGRRGTRLLLSLARPDGPPDAPGDGALLQALDYQSEAVVVSAGTLSLEHSELCVRAGLPVILAGRVLEAPAVEAGVDSVLADNPSGGRQAAELLQRGGCRRLAYLGLGGKTFSDRERYQGFAAAAGTAGLSVAEHSVEGHDHAAALSAATALLCRDPRPDGLFCSNDSLALGAIEAARALGLGIPREVSIVGFNDVPLADWRSFQLTTLAYPVDRVVEEIVALLDSRLADPGRPDACRRIPIQLVVRGTTRPLPAPF